MWAGQMRRYTKNLGGLQNAQSVKINNKRKLGHDQRQIIKKESAANEISQN